MKFKFRFVLFKKSDPNVYLEDKTDECTLQEAFIMLDLLLTPETGFILECL